MGHGEVEFAPGHAAASGLLQLQKIGLLETHVAQAGGRRQGAGVGDVLGVEVDAEEVGLGIVRRLQAELHALAAAELQQLEGTADLRGPVPVQQGQEGQSFGGGFALGVIGVAGSREVAVAEGHGLEDCWARFGPLWGFLLVVLFDGAHCLDG